MAFTLPIVEIPGFRDAVRRERTLRDQSILDGNEIVCGVVVRQLSLRAYLFLERSENGFIIPYKFDDENEIISHALQVLYFSTPGWVAPEVKLFSAWDKFRIGRLATKFQRKALARVESAEELVKEVRAWIDDACMDCPGGGGGDGIPRPSYVSYPVDIVDLFAAGGLPFSYDEIMDMPLKRLWQHWRLAASRVYDTKLSNPSDDLAVAHIAKAGA